MNACNCRRVVGCTTANFVSSFQTKENTRNAFSGIMCRKCRKDFKPFGFIWRMISFVIALILYETDSAFAIRKGSLMVPTSYTSGNGDLHVQLHSSQLTESQKPVQDLRLQVTRLDDSTRTIVAIVDVLPDPRLNVTQITIACQNLLFGGQYELEIVGNDIYSTIMDSQDERLRQELDIRWPMPKLSVTPESIGTYPQNPVNVILEFPGVECTINEMEVENVPEFWLELYYCGHNVYCDSTNVTNSQVLYAEQVRGYPKARLVKLRCELFGLAGHYIVKLRPTHPVQPIVSATAYVKADWSEQFVFNVHARSISPCDPHIGIGVLFEYPACILDKADRVRLFAKLRADVASLAPPTSLHYVSEQRVIRGQHSLHFDCELFSEKYIEYCFVYVSQAISGAVADVRMDCLPTLPVSESDIGGWGPWSEWTPCSTTCAGGTRNRYRVCDNPPPRYGAKFCQGPAVESEQCGGPITGSWECMYGTGNFFMGDLPADRPEVKAEIGPGCRCGCIVHLSFSKPRRLIASSAQSCPGRTFWLIQADDGHRIRFSIDFFRLICPSQYLRIRDGDSLAADLIAEYIGGTDKLTQSVISSESQILLEFYSNELSTLGESCKGGFLTHAQQIQTERSNVTISVTSRAVMPADISPIAMKLTLVHIIAILFASVIIIVSALLGAQYVFRYRKYQLAESMGELDSPAHTPRASLSSIQQRAASRAGSTSTLLSEVISLVKLRPRIGRRMKHSRLRESVDGEALESGDNNLQKSQSEDDISIESSHTLTNETLNDPNNPHSQNSKTPNSNEISSGQSSASLSPSPCNNSISLPSTPLDTPIPTRRNIKTCITSGDTKSMNGNAKRKKANDVSPVREEDTTETDTDSMSGSNRRSKKLSASNVTLTNGCYSPAASLASTATIRTTNVKESKEKRNREKLLAGPGSEFSLANPEDFELDYYDYNVVNAGAAPGSYLGMDPAYLVWIPPLDEGDIIKDLEDDAEPHYEEILPKYHCLDPGSNTETPSEDEAPHLPPLNNSMKAKDDRYFKTEEISRVIAANTLNDEESSKCCSSRRLSCSENLSAKHRFDSIQMTDFSNKNRKKPSSPARVHSRKIIEPEEKETAVVKSPSDSNLNEYYELDDIQFADDEDENKSGVRDGDNKDKISHARDPQNVG
ncbi:Hemicentin-1, partial [Pseudolycoriella hygida]